MNNPTSDDPPSIGTDATVGLPPTRSSQAEARSDGAAAEHQGLVGALLASRYEVLEVLGAGGMGAVYRARDRELDELVALKVIRPELAAGDGMLERFRREVKLSRRVAHRNVARMYELGEHRGVRFLTMEFVEGVTLASVLSRGRVALGTAAAIAGGVCDALAACHAAGVIHRDIKPDNVMLAADGRVVVTDFGIARAAKEEAADHANRTHVPTGTPAYMAPEQLLVGEITPRTDLYALGVMMFEMFTGRLPWTGDSVYAVAMARFREVCPDPRSLAPELPAPLALAVLRCMERDPAARFATATELGAALAPFATGVPGAAVALIEHASAPANDVAARARTAALEGESAAQPAATGRRSARPSAATRSLAVMPFRNGGPPEDSYLADGLTEDLIDALSTVRGLRVLARGAVMRFRGQEPDARDVGRELSVELVVEGSVRRVSSNVRLSTRLIGTRDGFQLWARRADLAPERVPVAQDEVAREIVAALTELDRAAGSLALAVGDDVAAPEPSAMSPEVAELYMRARQAGARRLPDAVKRSVELYQNALAIAPEDPRVNAGLALAVLRAVAAGEPFALETVERARTCAARALAQAPERANSHLAQAYACLTAGDAPGAVRALRGAIGRAPSLAEAHELMGTLLIEAGCPREGARRLEAAWALGAGTGRRSRARDSAPSLRGDETDAGAAERELVRLSEGSPERWIYRVRAAAWAHDRERVGAIARELERVRQREKLDDALLDAALACFGAAPGEAGTRTAAQRSIARALGRAGESQGARRALAALQLAAEFAAHAELDARALELLDACDAAGLLDVAWLDRCPLFARLRGAGEFAAVRAHAAARADALLDAVWSS